VIEGRSKTSSIISDERQRTDHPASSYIVVDLEWNQPIPWIKTSVDPKDLPGEIIEIGAVKVSADSDQYEVSKPFHVMIRPVCYTVMNKNVSRVTNKISSDLRFGLTFSEAYEAFQEWCGQDYILCGWGNSDLSILKSNLRYHNHSTELNTMFLDVQPLFARIAEGKSNQRSVEYAVDFLRIEKKEDFHAAHRDAEYTGLILRELLLILDDMRNSRKSGHPITQPGSPILDTENEGDPKDPMQLEWMNFRIAPYLQNPDLHAETSSKTGLFASWEDCFESYPKDREFCPACRLSLVPEIPWFRLKKSGFSLWYCEDHHWVQGRMRMKKTPEGKVYASISIRLTDPGSARHIRDRNDEFQTYGICGRPVPTASAQPDESIDLDPTSASTEK
jgi:DNA polymerase III epsilon subunit-like protein